MPGESANSADGGAGANNGATADVARQMTELNMMPLTLTPPPFFSTPGGA